MRVLVCGGRGYLDFDTMKAVLDAIHLKTPISLLMHGGAKGADYLAGEWFKDKGMEPAVFKAQWARYRTAAGPLRNSEMLAEGKPDLVVAFPGGRGTADMVARAKRAQVRVMEIK